MGVNPAHPVLSHQGRDQHQQRRFRQMKIGHQRIRHPEGVTGIDEDVGLALPGPHPPFGIGRTFDQAQRRGAHGNDPPARRPCAVDHVGSALRDLAPFGMHAMGGHVFHLHRQKGARAHMQRDFHQLHAPVHERAQQRRIEVERGGRGRHSPGMACENRLIIRGIGGIGGAFGRDIGWQRHQARPFQRRVKVFPGQVEDKAQVRFALFGHHSGKIRRKNDFLAGHHLAQRLGQGAPAALCGRFHQGHFDAGFHITLPGHAAACAQKAGRDHFGVVQHQKVAWAEHRHQIAHVQIANLVAGRQQQPGCGARAGGPRCDQRLGQIKVVV